MGASFPANAFCRNLSKTRCLNKCSSHFSKNPDGWVLWMWLVVLGMWLVRPGMCLVLPEMWLVLRGICHGFVCCSLRCGLLSDGLLRDFCCWLFCPISQTSGFVRVESKLVYFTRFVFGFVVAGHCF